jgi:hypothetical protein
MGQSESARYGTDRKRPSENRSHIQVGLPEGEVQAYR